MSVCYLGMTFVRWNFSLGRDCQTRIFNSLF